MSLRHFSFTLLLAVFFFQFADANTDTHGVTKESVSCSQLMVSLFTPRPKWEEAKRLVSLTAPLEKVRLVVSLTPETTIAERAQLEASLNQKEKSNKGGFNRFMYWQGITPNEYIIWGSKITVLRVLLQIVNTYPVHYISTYMGYTRSLNFQAVLRRKAEMLRLDLLAADIDRAEVSAENEYGAISVLVQDDWTLRAVSKFAPHGYKGIPVFVYKKGSEEQFLLVPRNKMSESEDPVDVQEREVANAILQENMSKLNQSREFIKDLKKDSESDPKNDIIDAVLSAIESLEDLSSDETLTTLFDKLTSLEQSKLRSFMSNRGITTTQELLWYVQDMETEWLSRFLGMDDDRAREFIEMLFLLDNPTR